VGPKELHDSIDKKLAGEPEAYLTAGLVILGTIIILLGLFSTSRVLKAVVLAWVLFP
jgi:hypothetical protein